MEVYLLYLPNSKLAYKKLGGGFKYFLCSPLLGEDFQFDEHIFQMGWFNHQPEQKLIPSPSFFSIWCSLRFTLYISELAMCFLAVTTCVPTPPRTCATPGPRVEPKKSQPENVRIGFEI